MNKKERKEYIAGLEIEVANLTAFLESTKKSHAHMQEQREEMRAAVYGLRRVLVRIAQQLAMQNVLRNTHSERNKENAEIIRDAHFWAHKPVGEFAGTPHDEDDIPF